MNNFQSFIKFFYPERTFHKKTYKLLQLSPNLNSLNERRQSTQKKIIELGAHSDECRKCQGRCCKGAYNHFTAIDYLIRMFSDNPIDGYGDLWKPKPLLLMVKDKILLNNEILKKSAAITTSCPDLTNTGCTFLAEDRPIRCVLWTCRSFRDSLSPSRLNKMGRLKRELIIITRQAMNEFKI